MDQKKQASRRSRRERRRMLWQQNKWLYITYTVLRTIVVLIMIAQFFNGEYQNFFLCILTLILFMIPSIIEHKIHIDVPDTLEIMILLFIFAAEILGEIREYYLTYPYWDTILHTINGFLAAAIGLSLVQLLNRSAPTKFKLSPAFLAIVAFCFSMTIGVLWEFFEYGMDNLLQFDMQKDTVITQISSVLLNPDGHNIPVVLPIEEVIVNGQVWDYGGYIDIGLHDTMQDLLVNFIGAFVFSIMGYFAIKNKKGTSFLSRFIPTYMTEEQILQKKNLIEKIEESEG